jgi:hypothetical protein
MDTPSACLRVVALLPAPEDHAQKKTAHAAEQERPDILKKREERFDGQIDLDPDKLVFIDETWASTNMARTRGRAPRGERLRASIPHGHWKTTTFVAGLRPSGKSQSSCTACGSTGPSSTGRARRLLPNQHNGTSGFPRRGGIKTSLPGRWRW